MISLQLSGSIMGGFSISVPRAWLVAGREDIVKLFKTELINHMDKYGMEQLAGIAREIKLHIHYDYKNTDNVVYICVCDKEENFKNKNEI